jgi:hypothetical protein
MAFFNWRAVLELTKNATRLCDFKSAEPSWRDTLRKRPMLTATPFAHRGFRACETLGTRSSHCDKIEAGVVFQGERIPLINPRRSIVNLTQPTDRRVAHVIGPSDVRKHLSRLAASNGFPALMAGQLRLPTKDYPPRPSQSRRSRQASRQGQCGCGTWW